MSDLARVDSTQLAASPYSPHNFDGAWEMAQIVCKSRLAPSIQTPEAAVMVMALGHDLGLTVSQSIRGIHVIEGKACPSADCMVACILKSGVAEYFVEVETTADRSTWETKRKGEARPRRSTFSLDDARAAGLVKPNGNWTKYPARMLKARAKAFLARDVYPDLLLGVYSQDEIEDLADTPTKTVVEVVSSRQASEPTRIETVASEPQEAVSAAPVWAHSLANAADAHALRDAANGLIREGIPMAEIKPIFDARLAELKAAAK